MLQLLEERIKFHTEKMAEVDRKTAEFGKTALFLEERGRHVAVLDELTLIKEQVPSIPAPETPSEPEPETPPAPEDKPEAPPSPPEVPLAPPPG